MAIDYSTDVGKVRLLISDLQEDKFIFDDEEIQGFLALETSVKLAAAQALDTIATSEALIGKVITTQDLKTDAAKLADALRKHADALRRQEDDSDEGGGFFDIADFRPTRRPELVESAWRWHL